MSRLVSVGICIVSPSDSNTVFKVSSSLAKSHKGFEFVGTLEVCLIEKMLAESMVDTEL